MSKLAPKLARERWMAASLEGLPDDTAAIQRLIDTFGLEGLSLVGDRVFWNVPDYIREEVRRQGHDLSDPDDGGARTIWMLDAWRFAERQSEIEPRPSLNSILEIAARVEPHKNREGLRTCHVRVGSRLCPSPDQVPGMLLRLIEHGENLSPLEWYKEFELIHPFVDGNGRVGKILLAWRSGTLEAPYFPPADLFGHPIANP